MKKYPWLAFLILLIACNMDADILMDHTPVLQVDAAVLSGTTLPEISVRRSFNTSGKSMYVIPEDQILVSGAQILLWHNDQPVTVTEIAAGRYQPQSDIIVQMKDEIRIIVSADDQTVKSKAVIPEFSVEQFSVSTAGSVELKQDTMQDQFRGEIEKVWAGAIMLDVKFPYIPEFMAFAVYNEYDEMMEDYFINQTLDSRIAPTGYTFLYADNYFGLNEIHIKTPTIFIFPEDEKPEPGNLEISYVGRVVIPEPIYLEFKRTESNEFTPVTVTNIEGGVGLFFGAINYEFERMIKIEIQ